MNIIEIEREESKIDAAYHAASKKFNTLYDELMGMDDASDADYMAKQAEMLVYELAMNAASSKSANLRNRKYALIGDVQSDA